MCFAVCDSSSQQTNYAAGMSSVVPGIIHGRSLLALLSSRAKGLSLPRLVGQLGMGCVDCCWGGGREKTAAHPISSTSALCNRTLDSPESQVPSTGKWSAPLFIKIRSGGVGLAFGTSTVKCRLGDQGPESGVADV